MSTARLSGVARGVMIALLLFLPGMAAAEGGIQMGRLKVIGSVEYRTGYDTNVFLDDEGEEKDMVHLIKPQAMVRWNWGHQKYLEAGLDTIYAMYIDNDENNYAVINPFINLGMRTPWGFYMTATESYTWTEDPYYSDNEYELGQSTQRWINYADILLGYQFADRYSVESTYANRLERYDKRRHQWQDSMENRYSLTFLYNFTPRTAALVRFGQNYVDYNEQNDGMYAGLDLNDQRRWWTDDTSKDHVVTEYLFGLRFHPTGKLRGEVTLGYGEQDFENTLDPFGRRYEDQNTWVAATNLDYHIREKSVLSMVLTRSLKGSPDEDAAGYTHTLARMSLGHKFTERLGVSAGLGWSRLEYSDEHPNRPRKYFNEYMTDAGVQYLIMKWLTADLHCSYLTRQAEDRAYEMEEHDAFRVSFGLKATL